MRTLLTCVIEAFGIELAKVVTMTGLAHGPLEMNAHIATPVLCSLVIIGVTSLATNSLIIGLLYKHPRQRQGYNLFVLQGTVIDLLCTIICVPFWVLASIYSGQEKFATEAFCQISSAVSFMQLIAPGIFLMQAAAYRHCLLTEKGQVAKTFSATRSRLVIVGTWALTVLVCVCPHFAWSPNPGVACVPDLVTHAWYSASVLSFFVLLPLSASMYVQLYDICFFRQNSKSTNSQGSASRRWCKALRGDELMVQKALLAVILIHALFWLPYVSISIMGILSGGEIYYLDPERGIPYHCIALIVSLASTSLKGTVYCFENPHMRCLVREQFKCHDVGSSDAGDQEDLQLTRR